MNVSSSDPSGDELTKQGYQRIYIPTVPWFEVVPVWTILGRLPLIPDFGTPTIPYSVKRCRFFYSACFAQISSFSACSNQAHFWLVDGFVTSFFFSWSYCHCVLTSFVFSQKKNHFPQGHANTLNQQGVEQQDGSALFYINSIAMRWARSKKFCHFKPDQSLHSKSNSDSNQTLMLCDDSGYLCPACCAC